MHNKCGSDPRCSLCVLFRVLYIFRVLHASELVLLKIISSSIIIIHNSRVDETATKHRQIYHRKRRALEAIPTHPPTRSARVFVCFFFLESHLVGEKEREREGRNTRRRVVGFVSLEKEDAAFGRARLRASVEQLSSISLILSREI